FSAPLRLIAMDVRFVRPFAALPALLVTIACSQAPVIFPASSPVPPPTTSTAIPALEREVYRLINRHRQAMGLRSLTPDPALEALAREHSDRMARGDVSIGHDGF